MTINHLLFADDVVIFAPSAKNFEQLLHVCSSFAEPNIVQYNVMKSKCFIVNSRHEAVNHLHFWLHFGILTWMEEVGTG